jgi:16S rRNA (cytosine967-C5)-methyltransferase
VEARDAGRLAVATLEGLIDGGSAERALRATLRRSPELDQRGRAELARWVHGVRCFDARLAHRLAEVGLAPTARHRVAAYRVELDGEPPDAVAEALGLTEPVRRRLRRLAVVEPVWPRDPVARLATEHSLPDWIAAAWIEAWGLEAATALAAAGNRPGPIVARANRRANGPAELALRLAAEGTASIPGRLAPHALRLLGRPDVRGGAAWREGRYEIQDEGSQLVARAVGAEPGEHVLDLCAGSGGKTLALAADMGDRGALWASEPDPARLGDLRGRVRRLGLESVRIVALPPDGALGEAVPRRLDRVLVDAPCSATGTWRRGPDRRWQITPREVEAFARLQHGLLLRAAERLRTGGRLVYATCSLLPAENEAVAARLDTEAALVPAPLGIAPEPEATRLQLRPDRHDTDGFFVAAWTRRAARRP